MRTYEEFCAAISGYLSESDIQICSTHVLARISMLAVKYCQANQVGSTTTAIYLLRYIRELWPGILSTIKADDLLAEIINVAYNLREIHEECIEKSDNDYILIDELIDLTEND